MRLLAGLLLICAAAQSLKTGGIRPPGPGILAAGRAALAPPPALDTRAAGAKPGPPAMCLGLLKLRVKKYLLQKRVRFNLRMLRLYLRFATRRLLNRLKFYINNFNATHESPNYPLVGKKWLFKFKNHLGVAVLPHMTEEMQFFDDGTVITGSGVKGKWYEGLGDILWKLPLGDGKDGHVYFRAEVGRGHAQMFLNKFTNRAFMRRGVVFKDRTDAKWLARHIFRPVIGSFEAFSVN